MSVGVRGRPASRFRRAKPRIARGRTGQKSARAGPTRPSKLEAARKVGLPAAAAWTAAALLLAAGVTGALATDGRGASLVTFARQAWSTRLASVGFRLATVRLQGATAASKDQIMAAAGLRPGEPLFALDLDAVRRRVEAVDWVASARVVRLWPDTLVIVVTQKPILARWRHDGVTQVIAADGERVAKADPDRFAALPLVVGLGANTAAADFLPVLARRPALAARVAALVRVDERRWDLDLKDGADVLLPADDPKGALARLEDLERAGRILDQGLARIDLRDPEMVVVRPKAALQQAAPPAPKESVA
ncbi:MAG TPA: cell division protein FtsQ/DivIB [Caulobacteraceae bacterium]|nr:cell division protein FtsQ/DivIB [Caulobacteraceae bacterium]